MIEDPDIFHAAKLLIDQHGEIAAHRAAVRADELSAEGDPDGSEVWHRILEAIEELTRGRREGERVVSQFVRWAVYSRTPCSALAQ